MAASGPLRAGQGPPSTSSLAMTRSSSDKKERIDLGLSALLDQITPPSAQPAVATEPVRPVQSSAPVAAEESEMQGLLRQKRWQEIIVRAEQEMAQGSPAEARLWWIRGHLGALSMPVSLLISPFEEVAREMSSGSPSAEVKALLEDTGLCILERMEQVGEREQVLAFRNVLTIYGVASVPGTLGKERRSWTLAQDARAASRVNLVSAVPIPVPAVPETRPSPKRRIGTMAAALCAAALALGIALRWGMLYGPTTLAKESFIQESVALQQTFPELEPRDPVGNLSALFYAIDEPAAATNSANSAAPQPAPGQGQGKDAPVPSGPPPPAAVEQKPRALEKINTKGPVEGREYREGVARSNTGDNPRLPGAPGRRDGSSPDQPAARTPFDRDVQGKLYQVTVRTNVVSSPSYVSKVMGRLEPGDQVLVDGRVGEWFRVRSRQGKDGYVLAQNATAVGRPRREVDLPLPDANGMPR